MTVDVIEYLSEETKREIAEEMWRNHCREYFTRLGAVAIGNVAYPIVREIVSDVLGQDADELIRDKAIEIINSLSSYTVFHEPNAWDKSPSPAWTLLQDTVLAERERVAAQVRKAIDEIDSETALDLLRREDVTVTFGGGRK